MLALVAISATSGGVANATELHSFFDGSCRRVTGVLVRVTAETVSLVDLDGRYVEWRSDRIAGIAIHKTLENPLAEIAVTGGLETFLRDVWVGDDKEATFTGWTSAFFDDLFLYFDLEGQTHVLDPEDIRRIRSARMRTTHVRPRTHAPAQLAFPSEIVPCGSTEVPPADTVLPSRMIADRIKVGDYLSKLEERYLHQAGFEERTYVYATPFVFDPASRLGLLYDPESSIPFPFYFRWSNGRPYRFQSLSVVGNSTHEWLPIAAPTFSVRSDIKSHFFNATFIGHVLALPAGTDPFLLEEAPQLRSVGDPDIDHSYNYLLLLGADYWRLSASVGTSYLASRINVPNTVPRTILATSASPTARLRYHGPRLQLRALYYRTRTSGNLSLIFPGGEDQDTGEDFAWSFDTIRLGATWKPFETVEVRVDQLGSRGTYSDNAMLAPLALDLREFTTSAELAISFGRYVTVRGTARLRIREHDITRPVANQGTVTGTTFGGALEFVF